MDQEILVVALRERSRKSNFGESPAKSLIQDGEEKKLHYQIEEIHQRKGESVNVS